MIYPLINHDQSIQFVHRCLNAKVIGWREYMRVLRRIAEEARQEDQSFEIQEYAYLAQTIN